MFFVFLSLFFLLGEYLTLTALISIHALTLVLSGWKAQF